MKTVLITGDRGFIGTYVTKHFLDMGWEVVGVDNNEKYGLTEKEYDDNLNYLQYSYDLVGPDAKEELQGLITSYKPDIIIAGAAKIGGIKYFHDLPATLLDVNERIMSTTYNAVVGSSHQVERVVVISSSMVYEGVPTRFMPIYESYVHEFPPPMSSYGFQKLATERWAKAYFDQFEIPYTIVRPFNCYGIGELKATETEETQVGNIKMTMSHVIPDLMQKVIRGQYPVEILGDGQQVRQFTHGTDLAEGIYLAATHSHALLQDFNLTSERDTKVLELLRMILDIAGVPMSYKSVPPFEYDVPYRSARAIKAREVLGWESKKNLEDELPIIYKWIVEQINKGTV